jgi:hypothetical protein
MALTPPHGRPVLSTVSTSAPAARMRVKSNWKRSPRYSKSETFIERVCQRLCASHVGKTSSEKPDYKRIDPSTDDWRIAISSSFMPFGSGGGSVQ